jgi:hypothetical protein
MHPPALTMLRVAALATAVAASGCGKDPDLNGDADPPSGADTLDGFTQLIGRTWDLPAGANIYRCVRVTVPRDMYITSIVATTPAGTHHMLLSLAGANGTSGPDGDSDCTATMIGMYMLYAAGAGTEPLQLPDGVGVHVKAGQQLHLNVHLFNASDEALSGESSIMVKVQDTPPAQLAEMVLAGPIDLDIPSTNQPVTATGQCTATSAYSLFAVWPHMHRLATRQKVELVHGGTATTLHDGAYRFEEQTYYAVDPPVQVAVGDRVRVTCTYVNGTGATVGYGDMPPQEMCFSGLYRFPAVGSNEYCPE